MHRQCFMNNSILVLVFVKLDRHIFLFQVIKQRKQKRCLFATNFNNDVKYYGMTHIRRNIISFNVYQLNYKKVETLDKRKTLFMAINFAQFYDYSCKM